jgi:hypothetical protein
MPQLPALRIAVLTDPHIGSTTTNHWHNQFLTDRPEETLAAAVAAVNRERPDIVLITGDLSDVASEAELSTARAVLDVLDAPWIACRGNHDQQESGDRTTFERIFGDRAPVGIVTREQLPLPDGFAMLVLDAEWGREGDGWRVWIPDAQVDAAVAALSQSFPEVLIVVCHFPFVRQSDYIRSRDPEGKNAGTLWEGERVLERLSPHAGRLLCFAGHQHFHHIVVRDNWLHCTTAALAEYPAEYRIVTSGMDGVTIRTAPGAPDVVAANPPAVTWVRGWDKDRALTWP